MPPKTSTTPSPNTVPQPKPPAPPTPSPTPVGPAPAPPAGPEPSPGPSPPEAPAPAPAPGAPAPAPAPSGEQYFVRGVIVLEVEDGCTDALTSGVRRAQSALAGVGLERVTAECTELPPPPGRRLSSDSRRLAGQVQITFSIQVDSAQEAEMVAARLRNKDDLTAALRTALGDDFTFTVKSVSVEVVTEGAGPAPTPAPTGGDDLEDDSHAPRLAALGPFAMALSLVSLMLSQ